MIFNTLYIYLYRKPIKFTAMEDMIEVLEEKIEVLELVLESQKQAIEAQRQLINDYKRMLDIPVKPERTLRVV